MLERSFSALVLVSLVTLAAPMLSHQSNLDMGVADSQLSAAFDARTIPQRTHAWLDSMAGFFEAEGYDLASAQLWATSGAPDFGVGSVWATAPLIPPHAASGEDAASS